MGVAPATIQDAFWFVLLGVVVGGALVAVATLVVTGRLYDQIGRGGLSINEERGRGHPAAEAHPGGAAAAARERDEEIRQLLAARNEHRLRRGEAPLDVEAELRRLTAPQVDAALRDEVRQLVIARNERRERAGKEPLDVEAEVERQLRELG
jgi:hypothetical protein